MNSFDARVRYTRMIIEKCFLELLQEKPAAKITVSELCTKAQINRATFYKHYQDIPQLLEKLEEDLFNQIRDMFKDQAENMESMLLDMMRYTRQEWERFMALGSDNGDPGLMTKTFMICYEYAYPLLTRNMPKLPESQRQMLFRFMSQGAGGILTWWIQDGMREEPEAVVEYIMKLCLAAADVAER